MSLKEYTFSYTELNNDSSLNKQDRMLLSAARKITAQAYAPYSDFFVGAAAFLSNKAIITATNQESASSPIGLCAERVLLSAIASLHPKSNIKTIAISYDNKKGESNHPVSPCGICRQSLADYEARQTQPIRLILSGLKGKVFVIKSASLLLPLSFSAKDLL